LYVTCRDNPSIFGPALIEKAYLKIMGGYDFPGSNSGTDLLALTGWIPEHVFLQSDEIVFSALWRRMSNAWATGDVLITLGTGRFTTREEIVVGLIGEHDYAVLEMKEEDGERMMLVKNPWSDGTVWKGAPTDDEDDDRDFDAPSPPPSEAGLNMDELKEALPSQKPGVFWISLENICRNFANIYLNWNPTLFTHLHESHFSWDLSTKVSETSFGRNPQFSICNPSATSGPVWILLSRHLGLPSSAGEGMVNNGFIALYLFDASGQRVYLSSGSTHRTPYVDSPQTLLCIDNFPAGDTYTLAVSSQDLSPTTHHFSLAVYSLTPLTVNAATETFPYSLTLSSSWTAATAGGNAQSREYPTNPQFVLTLPSKTENIGLLLETPTLHAVHVKLVYSSKGERVAAVTTRDIVAESGEYKRSTALALATDVRAGKYTVVASTFEPGQLGKFTLTLLSTAPDVRVKELPAETAGCFETRLEEAWPLGRRRLVWPMDVGRFMGLWVKARSAGSIRVRVLRALRKIGESEEEALVAQSGDGGFEDLPMGVRTGKVCVEWAEGGYLVVLERLGGGEGEMCEVTVVSEGTLWVGEEMADEETEAM
jgi:calpain-7